METIKVLDREFVPYIDHETIVSKIKEMAAKMDNDLRGKNPLFLGILNGSFMFAAELFNHLTIDCNISFLKLASYQGTNTTGNVKRLIGLNEDIKDRTVVIVEDIIDTGITNSLATSQRKSRLLLCSTSRKYTTTSTRLTISASTYRRNS